MISARIYLNDVAFSGTDYGARDDTNPSPAFTNGFHNYNHGGGRDVLKWGGKPHVIGGRLNLRSYLDKIVSRIEDGTIPMKDIDGLQTLTMRIELEGEYNDSMDYPSSQDHGDS